MAKPDEMMPTRSIQDPEKPWTPTSTSGLATRSLTTQSMMFAYEPETGPISLVVCHSKRAVLLLNAGSAQVPQILGETTPLFPAKTMFCWLSRIPTRILASGQMRSWIGSVVVVGCGASSRIVPTVKPAPVRSPDRVGFTTYFLQMPRTWETKAPAATRSPTSSSSASQVSTNGLPPVLPPRAGRVVPDAQTGPRGQPSSTMPLQSSSLPLQISEGGLLGTHAVGPESQES